MGGRIKLVSFIVPPESELHFHCVVSMKFSALGGHPYNQIAFTG